MKSLPEPRPGFTFIYGLRDPQTLKIRYVGQTIEPVVRYQNHLYASQWVTNPHKVRWIQKLKRAGLVPAMVILEVCPDAVFEQREIHWIDHYRRIHGKLLTNLAVGGSAGWRGMHHRKESRAKMSAWQTGRTLTPEHRANVGKSRLGHPVSEETRQKMRYAMTGRIVPEDQKAKMSLAARARWSAMPDDERRISAANARLSVRKKRSGLSSQYRGVCWNKRSSCWQTNIRAPRGKTIYLGLFNREIDAAIAYNTKAIELYGDEAILNKIKRTPA